jgi:hypothetical protein
VQLKIVGQGVSQTKIVVSGAGRAAIRFIGGSGRASGAMVQDITLETGPGAIGLEFNGIVGGRASRVNFTGQGHGVVFSNTKPGDYTEACIVRDCAFSEHMAKHVEYVRTGGNDSFNGSGFQDCLFNQLPTDTAAKVRVGAGCKVYNAPFDGSFSLRSASPFVEVDPRALHVHTFGAIRTEGHGAARYVLVRNQSATEWFHAGTVNHLTEGTALATQRERFRLVHRVQSNRNGTLTALLVPFEERFDAKRGSTSTVHLGQSSASLVSVTLIGPQYEANYLLYVWRNTVNDAGAVKVVAKPRFYDLKRLRTPTFSVSKAHLVIKNSRFPTKGVTAIVNVVPMTSSNQPFPLL